MPKRGIYDANNRKIFNPDLTEKKIFEYLQASKNGCTQTEMSKELDIPQSTISSKLKQIYNTPFTYSKSTYVIIRTEGVYKLIKFGKAYLSLVDKTSASVKKEFNEKLEEMAYFLKEHMMLTSEEAVDVTETVILYEMKTSCFEEVKSFLTELYSEAIIDIVECQRGVYIILNDKISIKEMNAVKKSLHDLYIQSAVTMKLY